jgi:hypothetical protein
VEEERQKPGFPPENFSLKQTKTEVYVATSGLLEMQSDHGVGLFAMARTPAEGPISAQGEARNDCKSQQYPNENESIYDQVADVVAARGDILVGGYLRLVAYL